MKKNTRKKNRSIGYLLGEGVRSIFRHGFMSFAAICVTVACLIIMGSFSLLLYNLNMMVRELEQQNEIMVYVDENLTEAEAKSVGSKINLIENVNKSEFISREQALENFVEKQEDDSVFSGLDATTFRHRFVVTLVDNSQMEKTVEAIRPIEGVAKIKAPYELEEGFRSLEHVLQIVTVAIIAILAAMHHQAGHARPQRRDRHHEDRRRHGLVYPAALRGGGLCDRPGERGHRLRAAVGPVRSAGAQRRGSGLAEDDPFCALPGRAVDHDPGLRRRRPVRRRLRQSDVHP